MSLAQMILFFPGLVMVRMPKWPYVRPSLPTYASSRGLGFGKVNGQASLRESWLGRCIPLVGLIMKSEGFNHGA